MAYVSGGTPAKYGTTETMASVNDTAGHTGSVQGFAGHVVYQIVGTWAGTVTFRASNDGGTTVIDIMATNMVTDARVTTTTANGMFRIDATAVDDVYCEFTTDTSGTVEVVPTWAIG